MLTQYIADVQDLLNDSEGSFFRVPRLIANINKARRRIAAASGCLRVMPPGTMTVPNQEVYPLAAWNSLVQGEMPGTHSILYCRSIAIGIGGAWQNGQIVGGSWKPVWRRIPWTDFQARFRVYGRTFVGTISDPGWWAQIGEGPAGKIYLAPIPSLFAPMELDLTCIPAALTDDDSPEPIPYPWLDAVAYWAAVLCLMQMQRAQDAQAMAALFNSDLPFCASVVCPQFVNSPYAATMRAS
jgi:hypothetical protein